jgi:hypothetical protein
MALIHEGMSQEIEEPKLGVEEGNVWSEESLQDDT